jgi:malonate transporter MadL subunit
MVIYGTALLSACLVVGIVAGRVLGHVVGIDKNIGGVGIAMLLLILISDRLQKSGRLELPMKQGILFWSSIYIPIVVAMAASQNVLAASKGGPIAVVAGVAVVLISFAMVPVISRLGHSNAENSESGSPVSGIAPPEDES